MVVQAQQYGYLAGTLANTYSQTGQAILQNNPFMAKSQGLLAAAEAKRNQALVELKEKDLNATIIQRQIDNELKRQSFDQSVKMDNENLLLAKDKLQLEKVRLAEDVKYKDSLLGLQDREMDLKEDSSVFDNLYKSALISSLEYSRDPSNPDNLLKVAQVSKLMNQGGATPLSPEGKLAYDKASFPQLFQNPENATAIDPEFKKELNKADAKYVSKLREDVANGINEISDLGSLTNAFEKFGATGPVIGKMKLYANQLGSIIGFPGSTEKAAAGEQIQSAGAKVALLARKDMPGQLSDKDVQLLLRMAPSLDKTSQGNKVLVDAAKAKASLMKQYIVFTNSFLNKNGNLNGLEDSWTKYVDSNSILQNDGKGNISVKQPSMSGLDKFMSGTNYSQADIEFTAKKYGMSIDQVKQKLGM